MKDRIFVMETASNNPDFNGDCDWFVVRITRAYARVLLKRIRMLRRLKKLDKDAYEIYFWGYHGDFCSSNDDGEYQKGVSRAQSIECGQLVVREEDVIWMCYPKHCDIEIRTDALGVSEIVKLAK